MAKFKNYKKYYQKKQNRHDPTDSLNQKDGSKNTVENHKKTDEVSTKNGSALKSDTKRQLTEEELQVLEERKKMEKAKQAKTKQLVKEYLFMFKNQKDQWKFQKAKQIWVIKNLFKSSHIDDDHFQLACHYLENLQGKAKESLVEKCHRIVKEYKSKDNETKADGEALKITTDLEESKDSTESSNPIDKGNENDKQDDKKQEDVQEKDEEKTSQSLLSGLDENASRELYKRAKKVLKLWK